MEKVYLVAIGEQLFVGKSEGPTGATITLREPVRYSENVVADPANGDKPQVALGSGPALRMLDVEEITFRYDAYVPEGGFSSASWARLKKFYEKSLQRMALLRSGLVAPGDTSAEGEAALQRKLRGDA